METYVSLINGKGKRGAVEAASEGESRSQTMRAFTDKEMKKLQELVWRE